MRPKLFISFSGGESSAYMTQWLINNKQDEYEMIALFANTGEENEQTLEFIQRCDEYFGFNVIWVEAITNPEKGKGVQAKVVNFETASRDGNPFEMMINKFGIPNQNSPFCTRDLKERAMKAYLRSIGWKNYYTAIGIRKDEIDRANKNWKENRIIYPLISTEFCPATKPMINQFWANMPFRIELKGYEDNCKVCWKKSLRKLLTIAKHHPERFEKFAEWEKKYENFIPKHHRYHNMKPPIRFFRDNLSTKDIIILSNKGFEESPDERQIYTEYAQSTLFGHELDIGGGPCGSESCEIY